MTTKQLARDYQLHDGLRWVDRLDVPHRVAYSREFGIYLQRAGRGRPRRLFVDTKRHLVCPLVFSPDGETVYHSYEQLVAIDVKSGKTQNVTKFKGDDRFGITWNLFVSPNGKTLFFKHSPRILGATRSHAKICAIDADGRNFRTLYSPASGHLWSFSCDFAQSCIKACVYVREAGKNERTTVWLSLDGAEVAPQDAATITEGDGALLYMADGTMTSVPTTSPSRTFSQSLLADGSMAFVHEDRELFRRVRGVDAVPLITMRRSLKPWPVMHSTSPFSSPDGRLLWFSLTSGERTAKPESRTLEAMQSYVEPHRQHYIELAHWRFEHRVGFIDWETRGVWMTKGVWTDLAWAPVKPIE